MTTPLNHWLLGLRMWQHRKWRVKRWGRQVSKHKATRTFDRSLGLNESISSWGTMGYRWTQESTWGGPFRVTDWWLVLFRNSQEYDMMHLFGAISFSIDKYNVFANMKNIGRILSWKSKNFIKLKARINEGQNKFKIKDGQFIMNWLDFTTHGMMLARLFLGGGMYPSHPLCSSKDRLGRLQQPPEWNGYSLAETIAFYWRVCFSADHTNPYCKAG